MSLCPFCNERKLNKRKGAKTCGDAVCVMKNQKENSRMHAHRRSMIYNEWKEKQKNDPPTSVAL